MLDEEFDELKFEAEIAFLEGTELLAWKRSGGDRDIYQVLIKARNLRWVNRKADK